MGTPEIKTAIIGGGYAGMAAAVTLAASGIPVTVFESARQLGGRARGVPHNDTQLDNGQHLLLGCYRETLRLIEQVGGNIGEDFLRLPLQLDLHGQLDFRAPRLPAPWHLLAALLGARGLALEERIRAARFMLALRRSGFKLPSAGKVTGTDAGNDMSVSELLARHGQNGDLTHKLWEPLCIAALNTPVHRASAQVLLNVLRDALNRRRADSDMLLPRLDLTSLFPQRAARHVERHGGKVHLSRAVTAIVPHEDGIELQTAGGAQHFTHVICAVAPVAAVRLLSPLPALAATAAQIAALQQQPIYTVYLQYPEQVALPHPMIGLYRGISQWLFDRGRIAGQHGLLAAVISAEGAHEELNHEELAQKVIAELEREFGISRRPLWSRVIAEKRATFCCAPNLARPEQQTALRQLLLAGDYTAGEYPATLEGAVISGIGAATRLAQDRARRL